MTASSVRLRVAFAAGALSLACHASTPAPPPLPQPCLNDRYVLVNNQVGTEVDVYHYKGGSANPSILGTARPGQTEFMLPPFDKSDGFRGRYPDGQWIVPAFGNQAVARRLTFEVKCR